MKRCAVVLCVLAVLFAVCVAAVHLRLMGSADEVDFRELAYSGDIAATEGLTLRARQSVGNQLYWDTELPVAAPGLARTVFTPQIKKTAQELTEYYDWPLGLNMYFGYGGGYYSHSRSAYDENRLSEYLVAETDKMFEDFILDVSRRTPAGGSSTETIRAREVSEYVPITAYLELYRLGIHSSAELSDEFGRIFRFPMPEEATFTVRIEKNADGQIEWLDTSFRLGESEDEAYSPGVWTYSVVTEDKCFFTLRSAGSRTLDFSDVSLGYGLYCLNWSRHDNQGYLEPEAGAPRTVLPFSEDDVAFRLIDSGDGRLLLVLESAKGLELVVLDTDTEQVIQRFTLFTPEELGEEMSACCTLLDGRLYAACDKRVRFFECGADGSYYPLLDAPGCSAGDLPEELDYARFSEPRAAAWDGERLAVIISGVTGYIIDYNNVGGGLLFVVYDASGPRYCGRIQSGAMDGQQGGFSEDAVVWGDYNISNGHDPAFTLSFDNAWSAEKTSAHEGVSFEPQKAAASTSAIIGGAGGPTAVIGGADGPTAIFVAQSPGKTTIVIIITVCAVLAAAAALIVYQRRRKKKAKQKK